MLVGNCTTCGKRYLGWALSEQKHQTCPDCGVILVIRNISDKYKVGNKTLASLLKRKRRMAGVFRENNPSLLGIGLHRSSLSTNEIGGNKKTARRPD